MPKYRIGIPADFDLSDDAITTLGDAGWDLKDVSGTAGEYSHALVEGDADTEDAARDEVGRLTGIPPSSLSVAA